MLITFYSSTWTIFQNWNFCKTSAFAINPFDRNSIHKHTLTIRLICFQTCWRKLLFNCGSPSVLMPRIMRNQHSTKQVKLSCVIKHSIDLLTESCHSTCKLYYRKLTLSLESELITLRNCKLKLYGTSDTKANISPILSRKWLT